jgi:hypothetical protein
MITQRKYDGEVVVNINDHPVKVFNEEKNEILNFKDCREFFEKPKVVYEKVFHEDLYHDEDIQPAYTLVTKDIRNFPMPENGKIFLTNRDAIVACRQIEKELRTNPKYKIAFDFIKEHPDNWRKLIKRPFIFGKEVTGPEIQKIRKFVDRKDLRAPGDQVRVSGHKTAISHCIGLISDYE